MHSIKFTTKPERTALPGILLRLASGSLLGTLCALAAPLYPFTASFLRLLVDLASHFVLVYAAVALLVAIFGRRAARWMSVATLLLAGSSCSTSTGRHRLC